jgi:hypothetical protein
MRRKWIPAGDASEDGHPCEAALALRDTVIRSDIVDEVPGDVLDLATQFAWIGKAISRTTHLSEWLVGGIDPNTWHMIASLAVDNRMRLIAVEQAATGQAAPRMEANLHAIRTSQAFRHALKTMRSLTGKSPSPADIERLAILSDVVRPLPNVKKLAERVEASVVSLDAFKKQRRIAD